MHRDVRWPNIIQYDGKYLLIDFDNATVSPSEVALPDVTEDEHAPEMLLGRHNLKVDIWGVGCLISSIYIEEMPQEILEFSQKIIQRKDHLLLMHSKK